MAQGLHLPYTGTIFYNICIYSRSQVSVYRTIGPLVCIPSKLFQILLSFVVNYIFNHMQIFKNAENDMFVVIKMIRTMKMEYLLSQAAMVH